MATLLRLVGAVWAIIGVWNVVAMPWSEAGNETLLTVGLIFNMLLFVLPGLVVYGIGAGIARRRSAQQPSPTQSAARASEQRNLSAEDRLSSLADLKEKGLISGDEYENRRKEIIADI